MSSVVYSTIAMKLLNLDETQVLEEAKKAFPDAYIELDHCDLFVDDMEQGDIHINGIDYPLYVNTHYVYEDHLVNGNKTRYKVPLTMFTLKKDPYDIVYDSYGKCYIAYEEEGMHFVLYEDFQAILAPYIHED